MQVAMQDAVTSANPLMLFYNSEEVQFLTIRINRQSIVQDTITQINKYRDDDLKRPLKVSINFKKSIERKSLVLFHRYNSSMKKRKMLEE